MSSKLSCGEIYTKQMSRFNRGDALCEPPALRSDSDRIQLADVGYIRGGRFNLLFSAGEPLGDRKRGFDVPQTFEDLKVGKILVGLPRSPGYLSTRTIQELPAQLEARGPMYPKLEAGSSISFQLTGDQGAVLLTKDKTYMEDIQLERTFEEYTKEHYDSWVAFARKHGHPKDIEPVLVSGVDRTSDFAILSYSNHDGGLRATFTISDLKDAPPWGTWHAPGVGYTKCGPQLCRPSSGNGGTKAVSDEYNQCVFVRYYTLRRKLRFPRIIKAAAGPHDLGPGGCDDDELPLGAESNSDTDSDIAPSLFDGDWDDDRGSDTSVDSESDDVVHNTTPDGRDDFDTAAEYVFENSDADSVLLHHRDLALLRERGGDADLYTQLIEQRPQITVDRDGVGKIECGASPTTDTSSNCSLDSATLPAPVFTPIELEREAMNGTTSHGRQPPSHQGYPPQYPPSCTEKATTEVGSPVPKSVRNKGIAWLHRSLSQRSTSSIPPTNHLASPDELPILGDRENNTHDRTAPTPTLPMITHEADAWGYSDPLVAHRADEVGNEGTTRPPVGPPPAGTKNTGSEHPSSLPTPCSNCTLLSQSYAALAQSLRSSLPPSCNWLTLEDIKVVGVRPIDAGGSADVWMGEMGDRTVALKSYRCYLSSDLAPITERFYNEVHTFDLLYRGGAHVAQFMGVSSTEEHPFSLLYEFMEGRDLRWYLRNEPDVGRLKLLYGIAQGLRYMHDLGVVHGNIRAANILIDGKDTAQICGLGNAFIPLSSSAQLPEGGATDRLSRNCEPELILPGVSSDPTETGGATAASDMFAFAVLAWEVFAGQPRFFGLREAAVARMILAGRRRPPRPDNHDVSDRMWSMIEMCWHSVPSKRPSAIEVVGLLETELRRTMDSRHPCPTPDQFGRK